MFPPFIYVKDLASSCNYRTFKKDYKYLFISIDEFCHRALSGHDNMPHGCKYLKSAYNAGIYIAYPYVKFLSFS